MDADDRPPAYSTVTNFVHSREATRLANTMREASESNWQSRYLIFVRGLPGSGKSTLARFLVENIRDAKIFSVNDHVALTNNSDVPIYRAAQEYEAQAACKQQAWSAMQSGIRTVVIDNENLRASDMEPYVDEGVKHGYSVHLVEPNTPWRYSPRKLCKYTSKKTSPEQLQSMLDSFDRKLQADELVSTARRRLDAVPLTLVDTQSLSSSLNPIRDLNTACVVVAPEPTNEDEQYLTADEASTSESGSVTNSGESEVVSPVEEIPPVPSCSVPPDAVEQLATVFPSIKRARLREYLHLANGDVQWASSLILEGVELANEFPATTHEDSLSSSDENVGDEVAAAHSLASVNPISTDTNTPAISAVECIRDTKLEGEVPQLTATSAPSESSTADEQPIQAEMHGVRITREFIKEAHELYSYSSGLTAIELSPEAVPDFLFHEWSPEPELVRSIYQSFMRYLGVLNTESVGPRGTPGRAIRPASFTPPSRRNGGRGSPYVDRGAHFSALMQQDEAMYRSVQDFRSSLDAPVVRRIIDRLLTTVPGIQRSTVEEAFVRHDFSETETEKYLLEKFQKLRTSSSVQAECASLEQTKSILGSGKVQNEELSLQEIQDEEEAVHRSVEDQRSQLQPLAVQLSLHRLKSQFPGIHEKQLETLLIKFDLDEQRLVDQLIKDGFTAQPVAPLISRDSEDPEEPSSDSTSYQETPQLINEQIDIVRQRIGHIRYRLRNQKDRRISDYYASELNTLYGQLRPLLIKRAESLINARAREFEKQLLQEGDAPAVASSKASAFIDLHGLDKACALTVLRQHLATIEAKLNDSQGSGCSSSAIVITGRGGSSPGDPVQTSPVLRPAVLNYFQTNGYEFSEKYTTGSGYFTVHLPAKKHQRRNGRRNQ